MTKIEWADETVNPFTGCSKASPGCDNCYAVKMAWRLSHNPNPDISDKYRGTVEKKDGKIRWTGQINQDLQCMEQLFKGKKGKTIFVGSMGDIAHPNVNFDLFTRIMDRCYSVNNHRIHNSGNKKEAHTFLFLTKRPDRFAGLWEMYFKSQMLKDDWDDWPSLPLHDPVYSTFHIGITAENKEQANRRIPILLQIPASKRFVSIEPMLSEISLRWLAAWDGMATKPRDLGQSTNHFDGLKQIDLIICGGESGTSSRPIHPKWLRMLRDQCQSACVPFFFKQWGEWMPAEDAILRGKEFVKQIAGKRTHIFEDGIRMIRVGKKLAGRMLDGKEHNLLDNK